RLILEVVRVVGGRLVEVELFLLDELHDQRRAEGLGQRRDGVHSVRRCGNAILHVGETESAGPEDLLILEYDDRECGNLEARPKDIDSFLETPQPFLLCRRLRERHTCVEQQCLANYAPGKHTEAAED